MFLKLFKIKSLLQKTNKLTALRKGFFCSVLIAFSASFISGHYGGPVMLYALLFGMAFHFLYEDKSCVAGIDLASQTVLKIGIALLGVRISFTQIVHLGLFPVCVVGLGILTTILLGVVLAKKFGYSKHLGMLTGGAVAICGVSAAMAIAAILPQTKQAKRDLLMTVAVITSLSTLAMIVYPLIVSIFNLNNSQAALFLGGTIHDVAQVIGAGYMLSDVVGETSIIVKLVRITFLTPVMLCIGLVCQQEKTSSKVHVPLFLILFFVFVGLVNMNLIPMPLVLFFQSVSRWCILIAISALGMKTSLKELSIVGFKPLFLMGAQTIWLALFILGSCLFFLS